MTGWQWLGLGRSVCPQFLVGLSPLLSSLLFKWQGVLTHDQHSLQAFTPWALFLHAFCCAAQLGGGMGAGVGSQAGMSNVQSLCVYGSQANDVCPTWVHVQSPFLRREDTAGSCSYCCDRTVKKYTCLFDAAAAEDMNKSSLSATLQVAGFTCLTSLMLLSMGNNRLAERATFGLPDLSQMKQAEGKSEGIPAAAAPPAVMFSMLQVLRLHHNNIRSIHSLQLYGYTGVLLPKAIECRCS